MTTTEKNGCGGGGRAKNVEDYNAFCEGDIEPHLCKKIASLIYKEKAFIVYLDEELYIEWAYAEDGEEHPELENFLKSKETGEALNRAQELQALPITHLQDDRKKAYRMLIGEGVARVLQQSVPAAAQAFDKAHQLLLAGNADISRRWYLESSITTALAVILLVNSLWLARDWASQQWTPEVLQIALLGGAGALGALLSILMSPRVPPSEVASSPWIHHLLGAAKILAGVLGAIVVGLGIRTGLLLSPIASGEHSGELLWMICMIAGASERLVPNFIERVESAASAKTQLGQRPK